VGGAYVEFHQGAPGRPERVPNNSLCSSTRREVVAEAKESASRSSPSSMQHKFAAFLWDGACAHEYVEQKPTFSLTCSPVEGRHGGLVASSAAPGAQTADVSCARRGRASGSMLLS